MFLEFLSEYLLVFLTGAVHEGRVESWWKEFGSKWHSAFKQGCKSCYTIDKCIRSLKLFSAAYCRPYTSVMLLVSGRWVESRKGKRDPITARFEPTRLFHVFSQNASNPENCVYELHAVPKDIDSSNPEGISCYILARFKHCLH